MTDIEKRKNSSLSNSNNALQVTEDMQKFATSIIGKGVTPHKTPEAVIAAMLYSKSLGIDPFIGQSNIYYINNQATTSIHLKNSLALTAGITCEMIHDAHPLQMYADTEGGKDESGKFKVVIKEEDLSEEVKFLKKENPKAFFERFKAGAKAYDWITTVRYKRQIKTPDGTWSTMTYDSSYRLSDAESAGLTKKDNWVGSWKRMLTVRAMDNGLDFIASDILLGMRTTEVWQDTFNVEPNTNTEQVTIVESKVTIIPSDEAK